MGNHAKPTSDVQRYYDMLIEAVGAADACDRDTAFKLMQDAWEQYRDRQCTFENKGTEGGSIHQMLIYKCLKAMTDRRVTELKRQEHCQEGDLSCVRD